MLFPLQLPLLDISTSQPALSSLPTPLILHLLLKTWLLPKILLTKPLLMPFMLNYGQ